MTPELVFDARAAVLEGPCWDAATGDVLCVDIPAGIVHRWHRGDATVVSIDIGQPVGAAIPRSAGGLVVAVREGIGTIADGDHRVSIIAPVEGDLPDNLMNDAKCDPRGRLWAGTVHRAEVAAAGALYRIDVDRRWQQMVDGVTISNGIGWSPDGTTMYYADSPTRRIDRFDFDVDRGTISDRQPLIEIDASDDVVPDGLAVDAEGFVWVALWGGGAVHRYSPQGRLDATISLPASQVSSCAFGGPSLDELYITTAALGLTPAELAAQPGAGGLFRCRPGVTGQQTVLFGG